MEAKFSWKRGDVRKSGLIRTSSYWCSQSYFGDVGDFEAMIGQALDKLERRRSVLKQIVVTGGQAEFFIGWFMGGKSDGIELGWELTQRISSLRMNLSFDIYGSGSPDPMPAAPDDEFY